VRQLTAALREHEVVSHRAQRLQAVEAVPATVREIKERWVRDNTEEKTSTPVYPYKQWRYQSTRTAVAPGINLHQMIKEVVLAVYCLTDLRERRRLDAGLHISVVREALCALL
jgi:hypothetical protein